MEPTPSTERRVNAWIYLDEDDPAGTTYKSPGSSYQNLIDYDVYNSTNMVMICFFETLPTSSNTVPVGSGDSYTIEISNKDKPHGGSGGPTNQDYLQWLIEDSRAINPDVKLLATMGYGNPNYLANIFSNSAYTPEQNATNFANNLVSYLKQYQLNGLDIDWEGSFAYGITAAQFATLFTAIRTAFDAQSEHYYLTLSPASVGNLDATTVNSSFDFVNLQLYSGFTYASEFINAGVDQDLLAYGAKFEPNAGVPYQDAQQAAQGAEQGNYNIITQWRLNSNNFQYEQAQQMILYSLFMPSTDTTFNDTDTVGAAGNPPITQMVVRSGDVLNAIQVTNTGSFSNNPVSYTLPQHGGNSGNKTTIVIPSDDEIVEVSGFTGVWFGWDCVLQITIKTRKGQTFGPFGSMNNATSKTPFALAAPTGQSVLAFSGSTVNVPLHDGGRTDIIASLNATMGE